MRVSVRVLVCSTGIVRYELLCGYANVVHTSSSFRAMPVLYTSTRTLTRILKPFEDSEPTGLKVDIACNSMTPEPMKDAAVSAAPDPVVEPPQSPRS